MISWVFQKISNIIAKVIVYIYDFIQNALWQLGNSGQIDSVRNDLLLLGKVEREYHTGQQENSFITASIRLRHTYILGATGSGKTNIVESFIRQDIEKGNGFCLIDCHGDLANSVVSDIASLGENRLAENTILIEPFNRKWTIGFNPLHIEDNRLLYPKTIEILSIFQKIWGKDIFGPRTSELFRNTLLTLMDNNLTLLEAGELLTNDYFRNSLIENISISEVKNYWLYRYNPLSEKMKAMYREAVINKLTVFTSDPQIRLMLGSTDNNFDFEKAINKGKWIILNLAKGHLKENMNLLATLFISNLSTSALQRINIPQKQRNPFFLYIDEFQNFCHSQDLITLLAEGRKYGIGLIISHQHSKQIDPDILRAILGNAQTQIYFRLSYQDSLFFASELNPGAKEKIAKTLIDLPIGKAYLKIKGTAPKLLSVSLCPYVSITKRDIYEFRNSTFEIHGQLSEEITNEIEERQQQWSLQEQGKTIAPELIEREIQETEDVHGWE